MASDRMMQAIGTLERAISRLEQDVAHVVERPPLVQTTQAPPPPGIDVTAARAALRSLDQLIGELKGKPHG
ncbi:MAG: hypothetical protein PSY12_08715 [bacterium]|nr:hypothetical protein [bacterium]